MIARLQALVAQYGDLDVCIYNSMESEFDAVNEIEPRRVLPGQRGTPEERTQVFFGIDPYAIGDWAA